MDEIGQDPRLRPGAVGEQRGQRPVRHDDGVDAAAALDRRLHRVDGGPVLRGVGHHAVPLPHGGGDVEAARRTRSASCATRTTTPTVGVQHMADLGVRYLMVCTDEAKAEAAGNDRLELIVTSRVRGTSTSSPRRSIVEPLHGAARGRRASATATSASAISSSARAGSNGRRTGRRMPADDGPDDWQRIPVEVDLDARVGEPDDRSRNVDYVVPAEPIDVVDLPGDHGVRRRRRRGVGQLPRRPDRRAGAGAGQLLPELGGERRRGPVPRRARTSWSSSRPRTT